MYSKLALFVFSAFALGVAAADEPGAPAHRRSATGQCDVENIHCCASIQRAHAPDVQELASLLSLASGTLTGRVGVNCVDVRSTDTCPEVPACCTGPTFGGVITVGCSPR